jgi:hypothetical protein
MKTARATLAMVLVLSCVMMTNTPLYGWGSVGHMAVAYVAYQQLTPAIKTRVAALLKLNPDYDKWTAQIPKGTKASDKAMMVFMIAATWPDEIKSETGYTDDGSDDGNRPDGAPSSQNTGYSDHLHHKYWHFVDTPFTQDGSTLNPIPTPNAGTEVTIFRAVLSSSEPDELKSYDLVWTLHLVGDIHQPLHAATRVSTADPDGDSGGNLVTLCAKPCRDELHGFWDDLPGTGSKTKTAVSYGKKLAKADSTLGSNTDVAVWIKESFDDAQNDVYIAPIGAGDGPFMLTPAYRAAARKVAKDRVALAGARLAALLNNELK